MLRVSEYRDMMVSLCRSKHTIKGYCYDVDKYFRQYETVTSESIQQYIFLLMADGKSKASVSRFLSAMKLYCKFSGIVINFSLFSVPRKSVREATYITDSVFEKGILKIQEDTRTNYSSCQIINVFTMLYRTGLRVNELLTLTRDNIDFDSVCLRIIGKGDKERSVPLHETLIPIVKDSDFMMTLGLLSAGTVWYWTKKYFGSSYSPHSFRHGFTTKLIKSGADESVVKGIMGHSSFITTLRYFHSDFGEAKVAVDAALN